MKMVYNTKFGLKIHGLSVQSKFNLMKEQGIGGISYWKIGLPFPQNWRLLVENFTITKKG